MVNAISAWVIVFASACGSWTSFCGEWLQPGTCDSNKDGIVNWLDYPAAISEGDIMADKYAAPAAAGNGSGNWDGINPDKWANAIALSTVSAAVGNGNMYHLKAGTYNNVL